MLIYTPLTRKALRIAFNAHKDQVDKCGLPYIYHPMEVAEQCDDEYSTCAALLHDVVEDTDTTFEDLSAEGFPQEVLDALRLLTHDKDVPYMEYVRKIRDSGNEIARKVKLADLAHNMNLDRLDTVTDKDRERLEKKYIPAKALLTESVKS